MAVRSRSTADSRSFSFLSSSRRACLPDASSFDSGISTCSVADGRDEGAIAASVCSSEKGADALGGSRPAEMKSSRSSMPSTAARELTTIGSSGLDRPFSQALTVPGDRPTSSATRPLERPSRSRCSEMREPNCAMETSVALMPILPLTEKPTARLGAAPPTLTGGGVRTPGGFRSLQNCREAERPLAGSIPVRLRHRVLSPQPRAAGAIAGVARSPWLPRWAALPPQEGQTPHQQAKRVVCRCVPPRGNRLAPASQGGFRRCPNRSPRLPEKPACPPSGSTVTCLVWPRGVGRRRRRRR